MTILRIEHAHRLEQETPTYKHGYLDGYVAAATDNQSTLIRNHEERVRALESAMAKLKGVAATLSVLLTGVVTWIGLAATHH
jgi:hypothetical protein